MRETAIFKINGATHVIGVKDRWKVYGLYLVSKDGVVKSVRTGRVITQEYNTKGYLRVELGGKRYLTHRLIAEVFLGKSDLQVDHINGVRDDNRLENLEYVTAKENTRRARNRKGWAAKSNGVADCPF